jgi:aminopeptidase-like protein
VLAAALGRLLRRERRRCSYLILFLPETIGAVYYLHKHLPELKKKLLAGFVLSCVGDERAYSYLPSRYGNTLADRVLLHVLKTHHPEFIRYSYLDRASDERQYGAPGADLPVIPFARSLYRRYPEYHTSLDDLSLITPKGLQDSFNTLHMCLNMLEHNDTYRGVYPCEPRLDKHGLYPTTSIKGGYGRQVTTLIDFHAYCDGRLDLLDIAEKIGASVEECRQAAEKLLGAGVIERLADSEKTRAVPLRNGPFCRHG